MSYFQVPNINLKLHAAQAEVARHPARFRVLVAGRRFGKCIAEGTPVYMADGTRKPIELLAAGDEVLSLNPDNYEVQTRQVVGAECNGVRQTVQITTAARSIVSTPHHPHLVNNRFLNAEEVKVGDLIGVPKTQPFGSHLVPDHELDFLAMWLAEGSEDRFSNGTPAVIDAMHKAVGGFGCEMVKHTGYDWRIRKIGNRSRAASPIREYLRSLDLWGKNSKTKVIPEFVFRLNKLQAARFLNLWFATDGCVTRSGSLQIGLANEKMVRQIADLLAKFGVHGSIYHKVHKAVGVDGKPFESWTWATSNPNSIRSFVQHIGVTGKETRLRAALNKANASRGNANYYLPVSYDEFIAKLTAVDQRELGKYGGYNAKHQRGMPAELREQLNSWRKQSTSRMSVKRYFAMRKWVEGFFDPLLHGDVHWEVVTAVSSHEPIRTYDIEVEGNHTFIANGVITHNTHLSKVEIIKAARGSGRRTIWYVAPTFSMAREIMWDELVEAIPSSWVKKKHETRLEIRLINGTVIQLKGADRPDTLRGRALYFAILDEFQDFRPDVWEKVLYPTLTTTKGRALIIGTPKSYNHFYELYRKGQIKKNRRTGQWWSWQFPTIMSPFFPPSEIKHARANLDPKTFRQEFEASFESMSGRVYYAFERSEHVGRYPFNPKLPIIIGQDFNVDPMSSVIMQQQPNGDIWCVDEIFMPSSNVMEVCEEIDRRYFRYKKTITLYPDPAGANRSSSRGESDLDVFRQRGYKKILYKKKHPLVSDRVATVNGMFKTVDGSIKMYVDQRCLKLIESLEQTIYKPGTPQVDKSQGAEHMADALGYPIHFLYGNRFKKLVGFKF